MERRSWLRSKTPLKRGAPPKRHKPMPRQSAKRAAEAPAVRRRRHTGPDQSTRDLVLDRDGGCVSCGYGPYNLEVHHRKPRQMGGRKGDAINAPSNLVSLCRRCHARTEGNRLEAYDVGLLLREQEDSRQVPLLHHQFGMVFLDDEGSWSPVRAGRESA